MICACTLVTCCFSVEDNVMFSLFSDVQLMSFCCLCQDDDGSDEERQIRVSSYNCSVGQRDQGYYFLDGKRKIGKTT